MKHYNPLNGFFFVVTENDAEKERFKRHLGNFDESVSPLPSVNQNPAVIPVPGQLPPGQPPPTPDLPSTPEDPPPPVVENPPSPGEQPKPPVVVTPPPSSGVNPADIVLKYDTSESFASQFGGTIQVINTFSRIPQVPESGIHGTAMGGSYGTQRFGKADGGFEFTLNAGDPVTSGSRRVEIHTGRTLAHTGTYWLAFQMKIVNWGAVPSSDINSIGFQVHEGGLNGLSPMIQLTGRRGTHLNFDARHSPTSPPRPDNSASTRGPEFAINFDVFETYVCVFRGSRGQPGGILKAWRNGVSVMDFQGRVGYDTVEQPYPKFGYYNWTSGLNSPRRHILKNPVVVRDDAFRYTEPMLRALVETM